MQSWIMNNLLKGSIQLRAKSTGSQTGNVFWQNLKKTKPPALLFNSIIVLHHKSYSLPPGQVSADWSLLIYTPVMNGEKEKKKKNTFIHACCMVQLLGFWSPVWSLQEQPCLPCWNAEAVTSCCSSPGRRDWTRCCHTFVQWTHLWSQRAPPTGKK